MSRIQKSTLENGIRVLTEEMPDVESSTIGVWVVTGSRNETRGLNGISHFIEHMLFKGTDKRTALDISKEIESVGGVLNAFTGREYTCFFAKVLNKDLPRAIDLLSDIFMNSKFEVSEMEREKMVVLQEIKMVLDTPDDLVHDLFAERFWRKDPIGWSVLGSSKTVRSIKKADIIKYFNEHYHSGSVFISAAGGLKSGRVVKLLNSAFGRMKMKSRRAASSRPRPVSGIKLFKKDLEQTHICIGVPAPPQPHPERYRVYLMNTILGGGMSSRLFQEIREKRGLAYSVYTYLNLCRDTGAFVTYAGVSKENFAGVVGLIMEEYEKFRKGVTAEELENAKEQLKGGMLLGLETSDNRMMKLARDEIYFNRVIPVKDIVKGIDSVTLKDLSETAGRILSPDKMLVVAMGNVTMSGLPKSIRALN